MALVQSSPVLAHSPLAGDGAERLAALLGALLLTGFLFVYWLGSLRRPTKRRYSFAFYLATTICYLAMLGPLDDRAETSAAAHMVQHMAFMVVIAPLWVLAQPLPQLAACGKKGFQWLWRPMMRVARQPVLAAWIHGGVIWFWHLPDFYIIALENPWWHIVEHGCFIFSAGLFWWAVLTSTPRKAPWALMALLLTLVHTGFLGAILTFADAPLYGKGRVLQDQQLAGLIMWVPGAIPYLIATMWVSAKWSRRLSGVNA